ncbi:MAG TPA: glycoside hydrolase family 88 protein [Bryobacteraceae bacterium]|nr:glycoside hydrolase family 88 protein [Bryobacteraceae bacterium]
MRTAVVLALVLLAPAHGEIRYVGLTQRGARIEARVIAGASPASPTVLLMGGFQGADESSRIVSEETRRFEATKLSRRRFRLLSISVANPDANRLVFPPAGVAYRENAESHALWRWIAVQAPDLVLVADGEDFGIAEALSQEGPAGVGPVSARRVAARPGILREVPSTIPPSPAHRELDRRRARSPRQLADELAQFYGHDFAEPVYIPAVALIAQLRLGNAAEVERLVAPYRDGSKDSLARPTSPGFAGHLVFAELAQRTGNRSYIQLVRRVADLGFTDAGDMKESMPLHDEMSDSVFMSCPILAKAGLLTREQKYFSMAARHFRFMETLDLRPDGIYRHSPLSDAAWARGNAFPALGLAWTLSDFPKTHADFAGLLQAYQRHLAALSKFQDPDGLWREVVDEPASYPEFSATAMIATAMFIGIRRGWLDARVYQPRVDKAWEAIAARVGPQGGLMDVCESTGKQKSKTDYLRRQAILGQDPRGGAMALLFATEMAGLD